MPALFHVVWHGAMIGFVAPWSHTKGELAAPRVQRERPDGADPVLEEDLLPPADWPIGPPVSPTTPPR